jgi:predicted helicase
VPWLDHAVAVGCVKRTIEMDKRSGIRSDPNRPDDAEYIVRLVGQVVRANVETMKIIDVLPTDFGSRS